MTNYKIIENTFKQANEYLKILEKIGYNEKNPYFMNPIYINLLFCIELYLKCILLNQGIVVDELKKYRHNLLGLYKLLNESTQKELSDFMLCFYRCDLLELLENKYNDFVDFRYMYIENKNKDIVDFRKVMNFMYKLQSDVSYILYGKDTYKELIRC